MENWASDQLVSRSDGINLRVLPIPMGVKPYLAVEEASFSKFVTESLAAVPDCIVERVQLENDVLLSGNSTIDI